MYVIVCFVCSVLCDVVWSVFCVFCECLCAGICDCVLFVTYCVIVYGARLGLLFVLVCACV